VAGISPSTIIGADLNFEFLCLRRCGEMRKGKERSESMNTLGMINRVELRKQWATEPKFSDWLAEEDNLAELSEAIGVNLVLEKREAEVGSFKLDILAKEEDADDRFVVIENQFEETDHDHLGKLLTYAAGCDAKKIVWIVEEVREEHAAAIKWLNGVCSQDVGFFLVKINLIRIGNSEPAPLFEIVEKPNDWTKEAKTQAGELTDQQSHRLSFWTAFEEYSHARTDFARLFNPRKPSPDHWHSYSCGSSSYHLSLLITHKSDLGVQIHIPNDKDTFDRFEAKKAEIESEVGSVLVWDRLPGKKASHITLSTKINWIEPDSRQKCFEWFAEKAILMKRAFIKYA